MGDAGRQATDRLELLGLAQLELELALLLRLGHQLVLYAPEVLGRGPLLVAARASLVLAVRTAAARSLAAS
ncbi:MAG: hypothetical protein U1F43_35675 [Myxococcota bacterium]